MCGVSGALDTLSILDTGFWGSAPESTNLYWGQMYIWVGGMRDLCLMHYMYMLLGEQIYVWV